MSKYQSEVKIIPASQYQVWNRISDLSAYQALKEQMPAEQKEMIKAKLAEQANGKVQISDLQFTQDTASCRISGMDVTFRIVEREDGMKCVKYVADNSPIAATLWVQLLPQAAYETKCRVTLDVDIPFFLKPMIGKKLDGAADQLAEMLTKIPY